LISAALLLVAVPVSADSTLKRLTLRHDLLGFEAVGRIDTGDGFCTGALIAPDVVLTAAHCLLDPRTGERRDPRELTFRAGLRDGEALAERSGARAVLHPDYKPADPDGLRQLRSDVALIELDAPIPSDLASPFATAPAPEAGARLSVVSYAAGRSEAPSWQRACGVQVKGRGALVMTCDTHFGSSGAPVFDTSSGLSRIVSLISRGMREDDETIVYGMDIGPALAETKAALRSGRGVWPEASVAARRIRAGSGTPDRGGALNPGSGARFVRP
jgi:protease YdgD